MIKQPLTADERLSRIESNAKRFRALPRMRLQPDNSLTLAVCGYSPSFANTWQDVRKCDRVMTASGAHDFLIARGVVPDYHAELDPRDHKIIRDSHPDTTYFIAAHCDPKMFSALTYHKRKVEMFYSFTRDDAARQQQQMLRLEGPRADIGMFFGRTNVGQLEISLGRLLGFRSFDLHGMDCCYGEDGKIWAGPHTGQEHHMVRVRCDGREFWTSNLMLEATDDFFRSVLVMPNVTFNIHGDGLLAARLRMFKRDPELALSKDWWQPVGFYRRMSLEVAFQDAFGVAA